ncbi:MAG: hypothetical protein PHC28_07035 [Flavobacterium sp.]|uniref:hypothetical protein n=1 Tax=Flavobacterium sp. TaxID=239 RepID=UPI002604ADA5|nr:hypothetical protein [Flavobacterium sp.]MDD5150225.1 hypothetical protein [Flavobacterium sp.]
MKELDLLKKDWQKNNVFEQVSEVEIYKMLHTKSSSIVKWILIVSILEFIILNGIGYLIGDRGYAKFLAMHPFINFLEKFNYIVVIVFIYLFYRNYKDISVLQSSKTLIEHILKTRKIVTYYIYWNIFIGGVSGAIGGIESFSAGWNSTGPQKEHINIEVNYITIIAMALLIMGGIWLFYKILYGGFLKKLKQNNEELKKIDL